MIEAAKNALSKQKFSSVEITKLSQGYLEFRIAGGAGYEDDFEKVRDTTLRFVTALEIACDPKAERKEYLKKLSRVLGYAESSGNNTDFEQRPLEDILDMGGAEDVISEFKALSAKGKLGKLSTPAAKKKSAEWIGSILSSALYNAFRELNIPAPSGRQIAELKLFLKRTGFDVKAAIAGVEPRSKGVMKHHLEWILKAFQLK